MASPVVTLTELVKVGDIVHALQSCPHNGFPVVRLEKLPARDSVNAERSSGPLADRVALMEKALSFANLSDDERAAAMQRAVAAEHAAEFEAAMAKAASAGYASDVEDRSRAAASRAISTDRLNERRPSRGAKDVIFFLTTKRHSTQARWSHRDSPQGEPEA